MVISISICYTLDHPYCKDSNHTEMTSHKPLTLFRLIMINIIAVESLRNISITAQAGWIIVTFYIAAGIFFLIPCILLTAEMATGYSQNGGIYLWTKEAFGARIGFIILWLQWIYNLVWFPSICGFFAGIIAYIIAPWLALDPHDMVNNPWYMITMSLCMFWLATIVNTFGIKTSSTVSIVGAIVGTLLPMLLMIGLASIWLICNPVINEPVQLHDFIPRASNISHWGLFLTVMFSLLGLEMSSIHAGNVAKPQKNFPRALAISGLVILCSLMLSNIAMFVINHHAGQDIDMVTGLIASFRYFFEQFNIPWMSSVIALTLIIGSFSTMSAWIMGLSRAFTVAAEDGLVSKKLAQCNHHGAPSKVLILQATIFSVFCLSYLLMPSVNSAYWFLSALTAQLAVIAYLGMFAAAIKLRIKNVTKNNQFKIYGGIKGTIITAGFGLTGCIVAIAVGFIPTSEVTMSVWAFDFMLIIGIVLALILPCAITWNYQKPSTEDNVVDLMLKP